MCSSVVSALNSLLFFMSSCCIGALPSFLAVALVSCELAAWSFGKFRSDSIVKFGWEVEGVGARDEVKSCWG